MNTDSNEMICPICKQKFQKSNLKKKMYICPVCGEYLQFNSLERLKSIADMDSFVEWDEDVRIKNPLNNVSYQNKLNYALQNTELNDAIITGEITISGYQVAIGIMDTRFMMASMGQVVGEKVTRMFEKATLRKIPVIIFCGSGGARVQEGVIALMQMEKTAAAVKRHSDSGNLYISILTNPTMGGVTASFAMIADIILAEKGAKIGFAGPRVIEQNTGEKLSNEFQTAEFQLEHGFIDAIVERSEIRQCLYHLLFLHSRKRKIFIGKHRKRKGLVLNKKSSNAWNKVQIARNIKRPTSIDYINEIFEGFIELAGDRVSGDDHAIVGGIAEFGNNVVTIIAQQKGKNSLNESIYRNWGMPSPEGYRKALRLMKQAEKFNRPIICFIDTIGAACNQKAEEQGQGIAIANLLQEMSVLKVPILSIIISEGGSGGALALGVANEVWMLENSVYYILTPEGYASILWKDNRKAAEAAKEMQIEANDLFQLGLIEDIIEEEEPVSKENIVLVCKDINSKIKDFLDNYLRKSKRGIVKERYKRFRKY